MRSIIGNHSYSSSSPGDKPPRERNSIFNKFRGSFARKISEVSLPQTSSTAAAQPEARHSPIRFINFVDFANFGAFPRYPENGNLTKTLDLIDRKTSLMVFISHSWLRGCAGTDHWTGKAHPDNIAGDKYTLCVRGIERIFRLLAPRMQNCYVWMDYGCMNQENKILSSELEHYDLIIQSCDCIFTPIVDNEYKLYNWSLPPIVYNFFEDYKSKMWNTGPQAYLNRGWCRVEMLYAANIPLLITDNRSERYAMFEAGLAHHCSLNRRPHFLYGTKEYMHNESPHILPPLQNSYLEDYHPLHGNLSRSTDAEHIDRLMNDLLPYMHAAQATVGYRGQRDSDGRPHGRGVMVYESGDSYEGDWLHGQHHGAGIFTYIDGDMYEGQCSEGNYHGRGIYRCANKDVYDGEWCQDKRQGRGRLQFANGDLFEGQFFNNFMHGVGKYRSTDGSEYEGEWNCDLKHGYGVQRFVDGSVFAGEWIRGLQQESNLN